MNNIIRKKNLFKSVIKRLKIRYGQLFFLTKHFLVKLVNNSLIKSDSIKVENFFGITIIFALTGAVISNNLLFKYLALVTPINRDTLWVENTVFVTFMMAIMGIICAVAWDNLFFDKEDFFNLLSLPIKIKTLFFAKFLSILLYVALISTLFNLSSTFVFTSYLCEALNINPFYFAFSHFLTNLLSNIFTLIAISTIHGILTVLLTNRLRNLSIYLRIFMIIGFTSLFFFVPFKIKLLTDLKDSSSPLLNYLPPFWFSGLQEKLLGTKDVVFAKLMYLSIFSIIVVFGIYFLIYLLSLRKYLKHLSFSVKHCKPLKAFTSLKEIFNRTLLKNPVQRGTFYFVLNIIRRNLNLKLQMGFFMAVPISMIGCTIYYYFSLKGIKYFEIVNESILSIPLVFIFFLIGGTRILILHPVMINASWVIRLTENQHKTQYIAGIKKALFFYAILPFLILLLFIFTIFWDFKLAVYHTCFCTVTSILIMEIFFINYRKMPFVVFSIPDKTKLKYFILLYLMGFTAHFMEFTLGGLFLINNPIYYSVFYLGILILLGFSKWYQYKHNREYKFEYNEDAYPFFLSLGFDK